MKADRNVNEDKGRGNEKQLEKKVVFIYRLICCTKLPLSHNSGVVLRADHFYNSIPV